jgi:DNA-binding transcriptional ArsR family regulator
MKTDMDDLARGFSLLSGPNRLAILQLVGKKPLCVTDVGKALGLNQWTVMHHLALLRTGPLVATKRQGKMIIYSVDRAAMKALSAGLASLMPK